MTIAELYQENRKIKVHANRYWSSDDVRSMCIRHSDEEVQYNLDITDIMYYLEHETVHVSFWEDEE